MILTEWNTEDAIAFAREEAREIEKTEIAKNLLANGSSAEFIQKITGLTSEEVEKLK